MSKINKLIVLNGEHTLSFQVGKIAKGVADSEVRKIKYFDTSDSYTVFLQDGNEIDVYTKNIIVHTRVGMFI